MAVAGAVVAVSGGDDDSPPTSAGENPTTTTAPPPGPAPAPDGLLAPTWVPDGMELWTVSWSSASVGGEWSSDTVQLFGDPDAGAAIAVRISGPNPGAWAAGDPVTVRGQAATVTRPLLTDSD